MEHLKNYSLMILIQCLNGDYVKLSFPSLDNIMTLIIENRIKNTQSMIIDSLKHNIQRLENVIDEGYFRGAGQTEKNLANDLKCLKYSKDDVYFEYAKNIWEGSLMDMCFLNEFVLDQEIKLIDDAKNWGKLINSIFIKLNILMQKLHENSDIWQIYYIRQPKNLVVVLGKTQTKIDLVQIEESWLNKSHWIQNQKIQLPFEKMVLCFVYIEVIHTKHWNMQLKHLIHNQKWYFQIFLIQLNQIG
ncbi:hypothetical protein BpHYR1_045046 [Brachionus plicatilis]|uniref:Uncharacterized protein n=1 Tax=Brachionus plicatilis TaxID=10195 RepID=A0A3M7QLA2_BRAPC|nr:hypothetical protein BpHYR1_045046 [Brachionus plicatilis]